MISVAAGSPAGLIPLVETAGAGERTVAASATPAANSLSIEYTNTHVFSGYRPDVCAFADNALLQSAYVLVFGGLAACRMLTKDVLS